MTSEIEKTACVPPTLIIHLTVFLVGLQSVVCSDPVVLHWYRSHATMGLLVRYAAAVDFAIIWVWTKMRQSVRTFQKDTTTKSWYGTLTFEMVGERSPGQVAYE